MLLGWGGWFPALWSRCELRSLPRCFRALFTVPDTRMGGSQSSVRVSSVVTTCTGLHEPSALITLASALLFCPSVGGSESSGWTSGREWAWGSFIPVGLPVSIVYMFTGMLPGPCPDWVIFRGTPETQLCGRTYRVAYYENPWGEPGAQVQVFWSQREEGGCGSARRDETLPECPASCAAFKHYPEGEFRFSHHLWLATSVYGNAVVPSGIKKHLSFSVLLLRRPCQVLSLATLPPVRARCLSLTCAPA